MDHATMTMTEENLADPIAEVLEDTDQGLVAQEDEDLEVDQELPTEEDQGPDHTTEGDQGVEATEGGHTAGQEVGRMTDTGVGIDHVHTVGHHQHHLKKMAVHLDLQRERKKCCDKYFISGLLCTDMKTLQVLDISQQLFLFLSFIMDFTRGCKHITLFFLS